MTEPSRIPLLDLAPEIEAIGPEIEEAVQGVLRSGRFVLGPNLEAFEAEVAEYLGVPYAVGLNSGTDALVIALRALGIGAGDEVLTTPFTFFATVEAILLVGAIPVLCDVDPGTFNLDARDAASRVGPRTRAIIPVHLFGQAADLDAIADLARSHDLHLIEDAAQAIGGEHRGRRLGSIGDVGTFSFYPTKNLAAAGEAGLLVTRHEDVYRAARKLRNQGTCAPYVHDVVGYNSRMDEIQAAVLRVKLPRLDARNAARRVVAERYRDLLGGLGGIVLPGEASWARHVYHLYTLRVTEGRRDAVQAGLDRRGVDARVYYPVPIHRMAGLPVASDALPEVERASREVLSLPLWPELSEPDQKRVAAALAEVLSED